jgi:two-component system nitrogen regulation sensor histidine kinase NtrY
MFLGMPLQKIVKSLLASRNLVIILSSASILSVIATYFAIAETENHFGPDPHRIIGLILINLILFCALAVLVSRRALSLWFALRRRSTGSKLQTQILLMFSFLTITPALMVSIFSAVFFHFGIQSWFNQRINISLKESVAVAEAYLAEHREIIRNDAISITNNIDFQVHGVISHPSMLNEVLSQQAALRSLTEGVLVQNNHIIAQTALSFSLAFERLDSNKLERAASGDVVIWTEDRDRLRALIKVRSLPDCYLIIGRMVDDKVLRHVDEATGAVAEYRRLKANLSEIQIQFSLIFGLLVLLLLLTAIWFGMHFTARLVIPITRLIRAAERVRGGDFATRVPISAQSREDEIATLGRAFNVMTEELSHQRSELIEANKQIDEKRRFSEAVLAGISAGVIALSEDKKLTLFNRRASQLLPLPDDFKIHQTAISDVVPELVALIDEADKKPERLLQNEITVQHEGRNRTLMVQITVERFMNQTEGYILTFDDISDLLVAQRNAAWSDVARRVAHEIKNPLTPIQLAAERLRRKFSKQITEDSDSYLRYLDTISRHVAEIGRMVEEFVAFARMPSPVFQKENLEMIIRKVIFSEHVAHPQIHYKIVNDSVATEILGDERQISRLFSNLLKNSAEAIEGYAEKHGGAGAIIGSISIHFLTESHHRLAVIIRDNGPGFPPDLIHRLKEAYVTTRDKGMGLGLAIVQKIVEDHKGEMLLSNALHGGAEIKLIFPIDCDKNAT